ncbi:GNAT family N-acetyltransferase [Nocardia cerradoensis]|uniref:GNAT family N-acetyltransferase n=1 Tax=Nocardia cerradoensis TaxID=85688 RepID=UPI000301A41F|nr:GNAT family N-acetyltransferase [Nocardia cerradoensis]NKY44631.1 GNAT family N-acetyltransferase [Nocardia cerradoensis]
MNPDLRIRFAVDDEALSRLHADAFGGDRTVVPWQARLERHSRSWVGAFAGERLVGFVHAVWDGGNHAFLLDTAVAPDLRRQRIGSALVQTLADDLRELGIEWLHVDFEPHLHSFYRDACGFRATDAGLLRLN